MKAGVKGSRSDSMITHLEGILRYTGQTLDMLTPQYSSCIQYSTHDGNSSLAF